MESKSTNSWEMKPPPRRTIKIVLHVLYAGPGATTVFFIKSLPIHLHVKYAWYFKYLQAKLRVAFPKAFRTDLEFWDTEPVEYDAIALEMTSTKNKIIAAKAKITKINNAINKVKAAWCELFPIEEDDNYLKALEKLKETETKKLFLENKLKSLAQVEKQEESEKFLYEKEVLGLKLRYYGTDNKNITNIRFRFIK